MVSNSSTFQQDIDELGHEAKKLGQATGLVAEDIIPGDLAAVAEVGEHLTKLGDAFERAGQGIKSIDSGGWTGQAGDAFRENYLEKAPAEWLKAADAFADAGKAVLDFQKVLAEAKEKATRAEEDLERANAASQAAASKHNAAVEAYESGSSGTAPADFVDPGAEARARAQAEIAAAKAAVQEAGDRAAKAVTEAATAAPATPSKLAQIGANLIDNVQITGDMLYDFGAGAVEGVVGAAQGLWGLGEAYFYSQPAAWAIDPEGKAAFDKAASTTAMSALENPYQAVKSVVDVDGWKQNPMKAVGSMAPDAVASVVGGAGVASRAAKAGGKIGDMARDLGKTTKTADRLGDVGRHTPDAPRNTPPWGDYGSLPPERPAGWHDAPPLYDKFDPDDGKPFGPQGSPEAHAPEPEPPHAPSTETPGRPTPDWYNEAPDNWLDEGAHQPEPHNAPDSQPPHDSESPHHPDGTRPDDPLPQTEPEILQELASIEAIKEKLSQALDQGPPPPERARIESQIRELSARERVLRSRI
ncbi:putative T7SS-secreted protein [Saccharopolyspora phatthalungensis]|uniref:Putative T7SS secretion signal domain-containing protein n=1 Tax=Saccharopolyspora phatthalungensis TaxID=664693 RepID=A0A840QA04_9PSEU|nr:hypothetical protein [Saccharopolyspora phatthalungensis]MBB5155488.1 hypothetical protein [Saccharopolyspora phatthalungensis]